MQKTVVKKRKLPNGIRLILTEDHSSPIISVSLYANGGTRYETFNNAGVSHFCQEMLLKGTNGRNNIKLSKDLEFLGADIEPFTSKDSMGLSMNILSRNFIEGFDIFLDVVASPAFKQDEIEKTRKIILANIYNSMDNVTEFCKDECDKALFQNHPYSMLISGSFESVARINRRNLVNWHKNFYSPDNLVISIVGDFKTEYVEEHIVEKLKMTKLRNVERPASPFAELPIGKRQVIIERDKKQVVMCLGFFAPDINSDDYPAFEVLEHLLSGMSSRLFIELRDNYGLAYMVDADYEAYLDTGVFKVFLGTSPDKLELAESILIQELNKLKYKELTNKELETYKRYLLGLKSIQEQRKASKASDYAYHELVGRGFNYSCEFSAAVNKITPRHIREIADKYIDMENCAFAVIKPKA
ncbi:MAG: pitrilysin family protein [Armatimonadota bacterium]